MLKYLIRSVFIVEPFNEGWIIEMLVRDIASELRKSGVTVRIGQAEEYNGEEVAFHTRGYYFQAIPQAKLNSVFMTHIDDIYKEREMLSVAHKADSIICMSEHSAEVLRALGVRHDKVMGNSLPHRGGTVRRPRIGIFSARYSDGRKNENWIYEYFKKSPSDIRHKLIICLIGHDWETFGVQLAKLGVSFEIYRYDRRMPGEYERQKEIISNLDKLVYMGFDGGSMSLYDGIYANVDMAFSDQCYHREAGSKITLFNDKNGFFSYLDDVALNVVSKENFLISRSVEAYVGKLLSHWSAIAFPDKYEQIPNSLDMRLSLQHSQLELFRSNYRRSKPLDAVKSLYRFFRRNY